MKKLFTLLVLSVLLFSCSAEERVEETGCDCKEVEEYAKSTENYEVWRLTGREFPTEYSCSSNGYWYYTIDYQSGTGAHIQNRNRIKCN